MKDYEKKKKKKNNITIFTIIKKYFVKLVFYSGKIAL